MTKEIYEDMESSVPNRLITMYVIESGYGGVNIHGAIVDRRIYPNAVPIQKSSYSSAPEPKDI